MTTMCICTLRHIHLVRTMLALCAILSRCMFLLVTVTGSEPWTLLLTVSMNCQVLDWTTDLWNFDELSQIHFFLAYNDLYLATGSQDTFIRVYKFHQKPLQTGITKYKKIVERDAKTDLETEEKLITVGITYNEYHFAITLETVLAGHEGWVYGVSWHPPEFKNRQVSGHGENVCKFF